MDKCLEIIERDCPFCNIVHKIEKKQRIGKMLVKNEPVEFNEIYYYCPLCSEDEENEFVPANIMDQNILSAKDAYRLKKGMLTSYDIARIRNSYGLSQKDFSLLLGFGEITITRYETKDIQDEPYNHMIKLAEEDPLFLLDCLKKHREAFSETKYNKIYNSIVAKIDEQQHLCPKYIKDGLNSLYIRYSVPTDVNGLTSLDIKKISDIVCYFASKISNLYKVKLMKLLWYADAISYKRKKHSMTGLVYIHQQYGALPIGHDLIIKLPSITTQEEENKYGCVKYKILPAKEVDTSDFTSEELHILDEVVNLFSNMGTNDIINYMHKEKGYLCTETNELIPFSLAMELNEF